MEKFKADKITPALIICHGKIDTETAPIFEEALQFCNKDGEVCLDFSNVYYISSAGLRVLLQAFKKNKEMYLYNPSEVVLDILEVTGFDDVFTIRIKGKTL